MKEYFEMNVSDRDIMYIDYEHSAEFLLAIEAMQKRFEKLNDSLKISRLTGEQFAETAKVLFRENFQQFERLTAVQLAKYCELACGNKEFPKRLEWPNADVIVDTRFVTNDEWKMMRHVGIGGSDAAVVLGVSPYKTARRLYYEKIAQPELIKPDETKKQLIFDRGHYVEPAVIKAFCDASGATVIPEYRMFRSREYPMLTANIDAIVKLADGSLAVFEAKTTVPGNWQAWAYDAVPLQYVPQPRQYAGVLNDPRIKKAYIGVLFTHDLEAGGFYGGSDYREEDAKFREISIDPAEIKEQFEAESEWWNDHILGAEIPERTQNGEQEMETQMVYEFHSVDNGTKVALPSESENILKKYLDIAEEKSRLKSQMDALDADLDNVKVALREVMGTAETGTLETADGRIYTVTDKETAGRKTIDSKKLKIALPDVYDRFMKVGESTIRTTVKVSGKKEI